MNQTMLNHFDPGFRPSIREGTLVRRVGDEGLVWGPDAVRPQYLDSVAALLLTVFDGESTSHEITDDVSAAVGVEHELALAQVNRTISLLAHSGALAGVEFNPEQTVFQRNLLPEPNW